MHITIMDQKSFEQYTLVFVECLLGYFFVVKITRLYHVPSWMEYFSKMI